MTEKDNTNQAVATRKSDSSEQPTPRVRVPPLKTAEDVKRELGRLYREMKTNKIAPADGTKLAYVLNLLRQCIETSDIEKRLQALEEATELTKPDDGR